MAMIRMGVCGVGFVFLVMLGACAQGSVPATIYDDPVVMVKAKGELGMGRGPTAALAELRKDADEMLKNKAESVMDKSQAGPSGDLHDYVSYGRYCWPNPKGEDLPWITIDGKANDKQIARGDANRYKWMLYEVHTLGLAYYYTGEEKYAVQAGKLARVWFLDPATRMNPNFEYAQAVPHSLPGRGIGLIENRGLVAALDGLTLIHGTSGWTAADEAGMRAWVEAFDKWLVTSKNGMDEKNQANNHGSWYKVNEVGLALYLGKTGEAKAAMEDVKKRIVRQIQPDGKQPLELAREDGYTYSVFNLVALSTVAEFGRRNGVDLWRYELDDRCVKNAIGFMMPFASHEKPWASKQLHRFSPGEMVPVVYLASKVYGEKDYLAWLKKEEKELSGNRVLLMGNN